MASLDQIQTGAVILPPRINLWGTEKVGKSEFAAGFPKPVFIPVKGETGLDEIAVGKFPAAESYADILDSLDELIEKEHTFKTVVIDSISTMVPLLEKYAVLTEKADSLQKLGGGYGNQEAVLKKYLSLLLERLDYMRTDLNMTVILVGHIKASPRTINDPLTEPYDAWKVDVRDSLLDQVNRWADCILFADFEKHVKMVQEEDKRAGKKKIVHASGLDKRVLYCQKRPGHPGGGRGVYGRLPYKLDLSYDAFAAAVAAARKSSSVSTGT